MASFTRISIPIRITYALDTNGSVVFEKEMTPVLDVDIEKIEAWAKADGIPVEREIMQWLTKNFVHTLSSDEGEKARLSELAKKYKSSFKVEVSLYSSIFYGAK